jgi:hypothetical protein
MTSKINHPTLHHVTLKTTRLEEMIDWYATVVGSKANYHFLAAPGSPTTPPIIVSGC